MHCHRRQGARSFIFAVRAHCRPAQLQRQQYQEENKQSGAGVHPENCSGIPGGTTTLERRPMPCPAVSNRSHSQARQHNKLVILRCASCRHTVSKLSHVTRRLARSWCSFRVTCIQTQGDTHDTVKIHRRQHQCGQSPVSAHKQSSSQQYANYHGLQSVCSRRPSLVSWLFIETTSGCRTEPKSSSATSPPAPVGLRCLTSPLFHRMRPGFANKSQANPPDRHQELSTAGVFCAERPLELARPGGWCGTWKGSRDPRHAHACGTSHQ